MRKENEMHGYQNFCVDHCVNNKASGLFLDMGLGKTATALTVVDTVMFMQAEVSKTLVIAPKKVASKTWSDEVKEWEHLKHIRISRVIGTERQRLEALRAKADVYTIGRDNVAWLVSYYQSKWPFEFVIVDELSSFKNPKSIRFKALKKVRPYITRIIGLTGTPAPNGLVDLWSQLFLLDEGQRLEKTLTMYRQKYFREGAKNGRVVFNYKLQSAESEQQIYDKIGDICISMAAVDYLDLPKRVDTFNWVDMSPETKKMYDQFEADLVLNFNEVELTAANGAVLTNKLRQFANGAIYDDDRKWHEVHTEKLEALDEDIEAANGQPVLIFYQYKHDLERIMKRYKHARKLVSDEDMDDWNAGKIEILLAHAASAGHGLNLQHGGHIMFWFGVDWALELYQQAVKRLDRQGQTKPVINRRILVRGTVDEAVIKALEGKETGQDALLNAVRAIFKRHDKKL